MPGIIAWGDRIPTGQVINSPVVAMDIFPTLMAATGADTDNYTLDGVNLLPHLINGDALPERDIYFEMNGQLAVRRGDWKLVLDGKLIEDGDVTVPVHLANLRDDMSEQHNLAETYPDLVNEMRDSVTTWYDGIEQRWHDKWQPAIQERVEAD